MDVFDKRPWMSRLKTLAFIVALLLAATQLWDWLMEPKDELTASVEFAWFEIPPQLSLELSELQALSEEGKLRELLAIDDMFDGEDSLYARRVASHILLKAKWLLRERLPTGLPYEYRAIDGIWSIRIHNRGALAVSGVSMTVPRTTFLWLKREGREPELRGEEEVINLGDFRPREEVSLLAWTSSPPSARASRDLKLTHDGGVGKVFVRAPVGKVGQLADRYWPLFALFLAVVALIALALIFAGGDQTSDEVEQEEAIPGEEQQS